MTVKGGYFWDKFQDSGIPQTTSYTYQTPSASSRLPVPANLQGPTNTQNTTRALQTIFDTTKRGFFNVDYNHNFRGAGWHTLKGGAGYQRTINDVKNAYPGGYVYVFWGGTFTNPNGSTGTGPYGYYEVNDQGTIGTAGGSIYSLFVQDEWQINDRLTMNLGVRSEKEVIPSFRTDIQPTAIEFGFQDKIAPRLGVAYDVRGDGRVKAFASWGRYFDWTKYELVRGSFGGDIWHTFYRAIEDPNAITTASLSSMPGRDLWQTPGGFRDSRIPTFEDDRPGHQADVAGQPQRRHRFPVGRGQRGGRAFRPQQPESNHRRPGLSGRTGQRTLQHRKPRRGQVGNQPHLGSHGSVPDAESQAAVRRAAAQPGSGVSLASGSPPRTTP